MFKLKSNKSGQSKSFWELVSLDKVYGGYNSEHKLSQNQQIVA